MASGLAAILVMVLIGGLSGILAAPIAQTTDPLQEFGSLYAVVVAMNVINTVIVLFYLWRIWFRQKVT